MITSIVPVQGWMLDQIVELDGHFPGFAGAYLRASNERRQTIAAYLATKSPAADQMCSVADFLAKADHKSILHAAFGDVPTGYRGALGRSGAQPHPRRFYALLHEMLTYPAHAGMARAVGHTQNLDPRLLAILRKLPASVCTSNVAEAVEGISAAGDLATLLNLLIQQGADQAALFGAVRKVQSNRQLIECVKRWSQKMTVPPHPVPGNASYRPVAVAADLRRIGLRYQNCLERFLIPALNGEHSFAEFLHPEGKRGLVVHLRQRDSEWLVEGLFGFQNARPGPDLHRPALDYLRGHGVEQRRRARPIGGPWDALGRLTSQPFYDLGLD